LLVHTINEKGRGEADLDPGGSRTPQAFELIQAGWMLGICGQGGSRHEPPHALTVYLIEQFLYQ